MENYDYLPHELRKLGLKKQEADIYLLLLENGYASISKLASKTRLSRPTIYRILENLKKRELISKEKSGSKNYFFAGSPDNLLKILKVQKRKVEEQEREFLRIISILQGKYHLRTSKNEIKILKSPGRKKFFFEDLANTSEKNIRLIVHPSEKDFIHNLEKTYKVLRKKMGDHVSIKEIYTAKPLGEKLGFVERKMAASAERKKRSIVITDKVFLVEKNTLVCIEEPETIKYFKFLFNMLWKN